MTKGQGIVHELKYNGGDCVIGYLRTLFPEFHSKHCDDAVRWLTDTVVEVVTPNILDKLAEVRREPRLHWIDDPMRGE